MTLSSLHFLSSPIRMPPSLEAGSARSSCRKPGGSSALPPRPRDVIVISYSEPEPRRAAREVAARCLLPCLVGSDSSRGWCRFENWLRWRLRSDKAAEDKPCSRVLRRPRSWMGRSSGLLPSFPLGLTPHLSLAASYVLGVGSKWPAVSARAPQDQSKTHRLQGGASWGWARRSQGDACRGRNGRRGTPRAPAPRRGPGESRPPVCAPNTSLWPVSRDRSPRGPGRSCPGAFGRGGGWTEPGAAGDGAGAWSTHLSPPPRSSRRLGAPQSPPGRPEGGREGKPANRGGPSAPASLRDPGAFLPPRWQWEGRGKKG